MSTQEQESDEIEVADVVQLRSGGQKMTVESVQRPGDWARLHQQLFGTPLKVPDDKTIAHCVYERDGTVRRESYDVRLLQKVKAAA